MADVDLISHINSINNPDINERAKRLLVSTLTYFADHKVDPDRLIIEKVCKFADEKLDIRSVYHRLNSTCDPIKINVIIQLLIALSKPEHTIWNQYKIYLDALRHAVDECS